MSGTTFHLLIILLGFSHLMFLNAVPITRLETLMHEHKAHQVIKNSHMLTSEKIRDDEIANGRMVVELNDYPGSGANNRHTPRAQFGRGCVDC